MSDPLPPCRSCGECDLKLILSLGRMPLANALLAKEELALPEPTFPLDLAFCPHCTLVQITETVPPERLFREYLYFSSFSDTMLCHAENLVEKLMTLRRLDSHSLVIEAASNDGYLLQYYHKQGVPTLGIEPAVNIASVAREKHGIETLCEFFSEELAADLKKDGKQADVFHAHNVLAHVPDLNGMVRGIRLVLKEDGLAIIEVPYVRDLIDHCEFDTIYHEHLCYFSLTALSNLFHRHGMTICDVERIHIHGGSLRLYAVKAGSAKESDSVRALLDEEAKAGIGGAELYEGFAGGVRELRDSLRTLLADLKQDGNQLAAYGAAAKGSTLLNYLDVGEQILDFVVDRNIHKHNQYMPGVHLPIYPPSKLLEARPDYVLLLTWNFADEIVQQQAAYRQEGGRFIIPIPEIKII